MSAESTSARASSTGDLLVHVTIFLTARRRFEAMNRLITAVKLKPVVDRVFAFEDARKAYEYQDIPHVGRVIIKVSKE